MGFIGVLIILSLDENISIINLMKPNDLRTLVNMETIFVYVAWCVIFAFEFLFVITALPICKPGEHLQNIIIFKVRYTFLFYSIFLALGLLGFSFRYIKLFVKPYFLFRYVREYFIPTIILLFTKVIVHFYGYSNLKYKDDGRDYVSPSEFISIHMTFSILHSWLSYFLLLNFFQSFTYLDKTSKDIYDKITSYVNLTNLAKILLSLMAAETCIFLAEYKDVIFALVTQFCLLGMYFYDANHELDPFIIFLSITLAVFTLITIIFDYDKAFYMKYSLFYYQYK
jgi:hypothetical protein